MIWLSILLVVGTLAVVGAGVSAEVPRLGLGAGQLILGVPWLLLAGLWGGVALGVASLRGSRRLPKLGVLLLEVAVVGSATWYVFVGTLGPPHTLAVEVGDPFPAYALADQDDTLHQRASLEPRSPALYIFYRGHW